MVSLSLLHLAALLPCVVFSTRPHKALPLSEGSKELGSLAIHSRGQQSQMPQPAPLDPPVPTETEGISINETSWEFHDLWEAVVMSYTITNGSNFRPHAEISGLKRMGDGWRHDKELMLNPLEGLGIDGAHGIVLKNEKKKVAYIVLRGTDVVVKKGNVKLDRCGSGCHSDLCADKALFDAPTYGSKLPEWCEDEGIGQRYIRESKDFVGRALKTMFGYKIFLCGHSLGAGLAVIVGSKLNFEKVQEDHENTVHIIALSAPPLASLIKKPLSSDKVSLIYGDLDPVYYVARDFGGFAGMEPRCFQSLFGGNMQVAESCKTQCIPNIEQSNLPAEMGTIWPALHCDICWPWTHVLGGYYEARPGALGDCPLKKVEEEIDHGVDLFHSENGTASQGATEHVESQGDLEPSDAEGADEFVESQRGPEPSEPERAVEHVESQGGMEPSEAERAVEHVESQGGMEPPEAE